MKIVCSGKIKSVIEQQIREKFPEVSFSFFTNMSDAQCELAEAEVLLTYGEDVSTEILERAKNLRWINVLSAGVDQMPLRAINERGILLTNSRGIHKIPMAEYTLAMILQVYRETKQLLENQQKQVWNPKVKMVELSGKTMVILGTGAIGGEIARLAKAFGMCVLGINKSGRRPENVDEIFTISQIDQPLSKADIVVSVLPSTFETRGLFRKSHFSLMKKSSIFINIGRGDVVGEEILLDALERGEIMHAVLDVFEKEPLPEGHPFWSMDNVTVTPHISGVSKDYLNRCFEIFEKNLRLYIDRNSKYINRVDLEKGY